MNISVLIKRHSVLVYYFLVFFLSWGSLLLVMGVGGIWGTTTISEDIMPLLYVGMLLGPTVAGLVMMGLTRGRSGFRELFSRLRHFRVSIKWYLIAVLTAPTIVAGVLLLLSRFSPQYIPIIFSSNDKLSIVISGLMAGALVGIFEELGWTGFVIPRLRERYSVLNTGLIVGVVWGLWHMPLFLASARASQEIAPLITLAVMLFTFLPAYRVLMVWVYDRTKSLFVAMVMHFGQTATVLIFATPAGDVPIAVSNTVYSAFLWVIIAIVFIINHRFLNKKRLSIHKLK